jgi:hypothetical protein
MKERIDECNASLKERDIEIDELKAKLEEKVNSE